MRCSSGAGWRPSGISTLLHVLSLAGNCLERHVGLPGCLISSPNSSCISSYMADDDAFTVSPVPGASHRTGCSLSGPGPSEACPCMRVDIWASRVYSVPPHRARYGQAQATYRICVICVDCVEECTDCQRDYRLITALVAPDFPRTGEKTLPAQLCPRPFPAPLDRCIVAHGSNYRETHAA
jgi:hypothetical protein